MTKETEVAKTDEVVETVVVRRKPSSKTIGAITRNAKRAKKELHEVPATLQVEQDTMAGLKEVRKLLGTKHEGKLSGFGHMASRTNGELDKQILLMTELDFGALMKAVAKANPPSRKSDVDDNKALTKRCLSHVRSLAGQKGDNLERALKRVGKDKLVEPVGNAMTPFLVWFEDNAKACDFQTA